MNKDMFFYSKYCNHCKDVINIITKANIRDLFIFVSVDENKFRIPEFITHVPSIITKQKTLISDSGVIEYIEKHVNMITSAPISPFSLSDTSYSTSYTFLTDNGYDNEGKLLDEKSQYIMLNTDCSIMTPKEVDNGSKSIKFDDSMYERYLNSRNADDEYLKRAQVRQ